MKKLGMLAYSRKQRHTSRYKTLKVGGKYIGEGTYGCGFSPALRCEGETKRKVGMFTKLMVISEAVKEQRKAVLLSAVDPKQKYILYPLQVCKVNESLLGPTNPENNIASCKKTFAPSRLSQARAVQYLDGGDDLRKIRLEAADIFPFFKALPYLLKGLFKLHFHHIIHGDIKPDNIVVKKLPKGTFDFRFIDISFVHDVREPITPDLPFDADYYPWPFEMRYTIDRNLYDIEDQLIKWLRTVKKTEYVPPEIFVDFKTGEEVLTEKRAISILDYIEKEASKLVKNNNNHNDPSEQIDKIINSYILKKADIYSLGSVFAFCYHKTIRHEMSDNSILVYLPWTKGPIGVNDLASTGLNDESVKWHTEVAEKISKPYYILVKKMMNPQTKKRIQISTAILKYKSLLKEMKVFFTEDLITKHLIVAAKK